VPVGEEESEDGTVWGEGSDGEEKLVREREETGQPAFRRR
jgi:hypothetical protein